MKVLNIHRHDAANIGDLASSPVQYFDWLREVEVVDIHASPSVEADWYIVGGGGLFHSAWLPWLSDHAAKHAARTIVWGAGSNMHGETTTVLPDWLTDCPLVGIRDLGTRFDFVPCASCLSETFTRDHKSPFHEEVSYTHPGVPHPDNIPHLTNNCASVEEAISFLASGKRITTSSYHGAYWGNLLGRSVTISDPISSRFFAMPTEHSLGECVRINREFADRVRKLIGL